MERVEDCYRCLSSELDEAVNVAMVAGRVRPSPDVDIHSQRGVTRM